MAKYPDYRYPEPIPIKNRKWPDKIITRTPVWCSVDLRDGNQALPVPMNPEKKAKYFEMLTRIGFKDIEVSFPSASKDDFDFVRVLIGEGKIPRDTRISVLTQVRRHLIERTVESLKGADKAILHCYLATSDLHSQIVFNKTRSEVKAMAIEGTRIAIDCLAKADLMGRVAYEFSPEEFTDSDIDFVVDLCEELKALWGPCAKSDFILNLPATVERRPPYQYADMIEYFISKYKGLDSTTISVHAHNDQGCAVAATEMAVMAGADRVEGTLFGHGERTGNVDIVVFALNLFSRGIDIGLDFSNLPEIAREVELASGIYVHQRHPYAGDLVFTAFSGSHQDAIRKGMQDKERRKAADLFKMNWKVPYLHVDPAVFGKEYERLIRINSQSGKGGIAYVLESEYGLRLPKAMHPEIGRLVQKLADEKGDEVHASEVMALFKKNFMECAGPYKLLQFNRVSGEERDSGDVNIRVTLDIEGRTVQAEGSGNGPISAFVHALSGMPVIEFTLDDFEEQAVGHGENAMAVSYISVKRASDGKVYYGAGEHSNIDQAAMRALIAALNRAAAN